ncbi:expansin-like B1 isoform X2 [Syzygium oleosum]|uniref:expansin-like B1 isoform X2 n=1 Tax=Syzygium oleosum TaxID=219896 RepID=UPI0024BAA1F2|nr:expansin-like B1 isoform X2 [Syzygium oleosum]
MFSINISKAHCFSCTTAFFFLGLRVAWFCFHIMALKLKLLLSLSATLFLMQTPANGATCNNCFVSSRASYYPNSSQQGTEIGACGFGSFGAMINGGDVSAASDLYRSGVGCGACYQVRCTSSKYCSDKGVTVVITDQGSGDRTDFILSQRAYSQMAQTADAASYLSALGVVDIEYRRYPNKNITIKIDESSNNPHYLAFVIWYQQGNKDITAVQLCETQNFVCKLLDRNYGAVWTTTSPPSGPLSLRMLLSSDDGDETWLVPVNNIHQDWKAGETYDTGVQIS